MREFIYFSQHARTSGHIHDLLRAGRIDIACHVIVSSFFFSRARRPYVRLHMIFNGPPDAPKHLEIFGARARISKREPAELISHMLYKYKRGRKVEAFEDCWIEKKSFLDLVEELHEQGKTIYMLDPKGEDIRTAKIENDPVFIFGDHEGIPKREIKRVKEITKKISLGPLEYFASHVVALVHNELDRRGIW
ncbi:hypothetical protein COS75_01230 [Candidatus Pacearchaeota archaeon CG06_land_8_20_14_3_00_35_12]|nr:MAG: hypothetical protein COS75_01230 [Candidatus Pacearchaeota archaeon CG06_land_8_20_14_3_00_35_12]